ncbi:Uncharacterised protein [Vibrio cholerae]|nr:Uncharacterised protein [Vibrio cholerae]CSD70401.1 Uncharacterised protein [Vibrio cholerae]
MFDSRLCKWAARTFLNHQAIGIGHALLLNKFSWMLSP